MVVVKEVTLGRHHLRPGRTKHTLVDGQGRRDFAPFTSLQIAHDPDSSGYFLLYFTEQGAGTDTFHLSLEDALHQAEWEFEVKSEEWTDVRDGAA